MVGEKLIAASLIVNGKLFEADKPVTVSITVTATELFSTVVGTPLIVVPLKLKPVGKVAGSMLMVMASALGAVAVTALE